MAEIKRKFQTEDFTWSSSTLTSAVVEVSESNRAAIYFPSTFHTSSVLVQGAESRSGTFGVLYDDAGSSVSALTNITTSTWQEVPEELMAMHTIRLVATTTTSVVHTLKIAAKG